MKDLSGIAELQALIAKVNFLKQDTSAIPAQWNKAWADSQEILQVIRDIVEVARGIFKDMMIDVTELPRLDVVLENLAQAGEKFENLYQKSAPAFQLLLKIVNISSKLATQINFVYDVDTSMFGDRVWEVKKDKLFYGDFATISSFISTLYDFYTMSAETDPLPRKSPLEKHLLDLRSAGGLLLDSFVPGVVYRKVPEVVVEIEHLGKEINTFMELFRRAVEHGFFKQEIQNARQCFSNLVVSEKIKDTKPFKLEGIMGIKEKVKDFVILFDLVNF